MLVHVQFWFHLKKDSRGDQIKNAKLLTNQNACIYIDEDEILNINILKIIKKL